MEMSYAYVPRLFAQRFQFTQAGARIDPELTTPREILSVNADDVDLNGVVDGQDALDVLFNIDRASSELSGFISIHLDANFDGYVDEGDLTEVQRTMGRVYP